jgi:ribosome-associated translation inhibitor RaiA
MQVQLHTDNHIEGTAKLTSYVEALVQDSLDRFTRRITRVEVHLIDQNSSAKGGSNDKRCSMEARVSGRDPVNVTADAPTVDQALNSAITKLEKSLTHLFDKLDHAKGRPSLSEHAALADQNSLDEEPLSEEISL